MQGLTQRQRHVLEQIHHVIRETGHPPTVREIMERLGLSSTCTVQRHLEALERKGFIRRSRLKARTVEIIKADDPRLVPKTTVPVPLLGTVAAGQPILAVENIEEVLPLPAELVPEEPAFCLRVKGESMIEAGLFDGDLVVVRQQDSAEEGDVVVAMIDDEATIKTFQRQNGQVRLQPANRNMEPIILPQNQVTILGRVILGLRRF
ncbi:MAG: transcriptional repressor LexA [Armatimonadetes bacterium]|nr:transcriptional repressor LexA [Armatimonadota bacterium]NIM22851.1 transcriptional repressor LexA [Armatimonadota bacterium]NIM66717.1 transcriptional repressor LexA [Armatimonadota bacterium]NIM75274.1 transcriptional repressor LexA [Armatimonadota bacterium]NIN04914.1 transcriptional repressor LexA [Armatimonadota bacterium]